MQQTLEQRGWYAAARCKGIFRYHLRSLGKIVAWVLAVLLGSGMLTLLLPLIFPTMEFSMSPLFAANAGLTILFAMIRGNTVAHRSTRFLLRFGTPRFSVWLCNVLSLLAAMLVLLLGTLAVNAALAYLALPFADKMTQSPLLAYGIRSVPYTAEALATSFSNAIAALPGQMLLVAEYVSIFYLLGCCLRRRKALTLTIVIGVPLALMMLMIIPAVQQTVDIAISGEQREIMAAGLQWMQWISKAAQFLREQWPLIQLLTAIVCLPLSYWCMRGTKQP